jgi:predicted PurR-regulated permease PerM
VLVITAALFKLKDLVLVVLMSIVIASSIEPAAKWLIQRKFPRIIAVISIYISLAALLFASIYFLVIPLLSESSSFLKNLPTYFNPGVISNTIAQSNFLSSQSIVQGISNTVNLDQALGQINGFISSLASSTFNTVSGVFGGILSFILIIVLSFYLSVAEDGVGKFLKVISPIKHEKYVVSLWQRSQKKIGQWMQGQIVLAVIIGMLVYLGLTLLQIDNALLLAALAAICEIIPLFGPILASIPAIAIAFVSGGFTQAILVVGLYLIVHQFENQLIYPLVVKKVVGVSPVVSIIALVAGWELAGFLGIVLSVPLASVLIEFLDDLEKNKVEAVERMLNKNS